MKNKSPISNWAIALCAIAVLSFAGTAHGFTFEPGPVITIIPDDVTITPGGTVTPAPEEPSERIKPLPRVAPPIQMGDFQGTLIVD